MSFYATDKNLTLAPRHKTQTDFVKKGYAERNEEQCKILAKEIKIEHATRIEESFGKSKEYNNLKKNKAITKKRNPANILRNPYCKSLGNRKKDFAPDPQLLHLIRDYDGFTTK